MTLTNTSLSIPYRYIRTASTAEAARARGRHVSVAGRIVRLRRHGNIAFADLRDAAGEIQLMFDVETTEGFESVGDVSMGSWIGASGVVTTSRSGTVTISVAQWQLLALCRTGWPDARNGVLDRETRLRRRWIDLWTNSESMRRFHDRSRIISFTRRYLEALGFVEVETPILHRLPGGANAKPFITHHNALGMDLYLRIAPELYLKRCVAAGLERVFEIGRVFRNEGISTRHNPEFTMLEAYAAYADLSDMMELTEYLVAELAVELRGTTCIEVDGEPLDLAAPWPRRPMLQLVSEAVGVDLALERPSEVEAAARTAGIDIDRGWGPGRVVAELYEVLCERSLRGPVFVTDYPVEVSPLARKHRAHSGFAERFEAIIGGSELANAFTELVDPDEQRARFEEQTARRAAGDEEAMPLDEDYLDALAFGLPPTGGLGIGIDRMVMLLTGARSIRDVVLFPTLRGRAS